MMLQFKIEQLALCPKDPARAKALLAAIGIGEWVNDTVVATGAVFGAEGSNKADLAFNYEAFAGKELEVLNYTEGDNWMLHGSRPNSISHLGMHCTEEELVEWKILFASHGCSIAQEVWTDSHTNPYLVSNGRKYHYCIFDCKEILGVDLKFIVRRDRPEAQ